MNGLPEVLAVSGDNTNQAALLLKVAANSSAFTGHFPAVPLLPGVTQVDWALKLARLHLSSIAMHRGEFHRLAGLKFRRVITPGTILSLELSWSSPQLTFRYISDKDGEVYSQGRIVL